MEAVNSRTTSALPLSVGTSLAFESVFTGLGPSIDPDRVIPQQIDLENYDQIWVNIGTLFRNLYNAIPRGDVSRVSPRDAADGIAMEMDTINDLARSNTNGRVGVVYYNCNFDDIPTRFKLGSIRVAKTALQLQYATLYEKTIQILLGRSRQGTLLNIVEYKSKFSGGNKRALFFTHFATDILNHRKFRSFDLLESHTGLLKKEPQWHTKYYQGRDLNMLPMNGILLTVFGDDHQFHPQPKKMKEALLTLAKERKWTCLSQPAEIVNGIKSMKDHALRDALLLQEQYS